MNFNLFNSNMEFNYNYYNIFQVLWDTQKNSYLCDLLTFWSLNKQLLF